MNLLAINFSPRKKGHTYRYLCKIIEQLQPCHSEIVNFPALNIGYCIGCLDCEWAGKCILKDDWSLVVKKIEKADTIIFGSPIYAWQLAAPVHIFTNRCRAYISYNEGMGFPGLSYEEAKERYYKKYPKAPHPPLFRIRIKKSRDCYIIVTQGRPNPRNFMPALRIFSDFVKKILLMRIKKLYIITSSGAPHGGNIFELKNNNKLIKSNGITA